MSFPKDRELTITRDVDIPAEKLYRCWTDPRLLVQWFTPKPWSTVSAQLDVRSGGSCRVVMRSPEGQEFPNPGIYLEIVPNKRIVFTDAFTAAWEPSEKPFFTAIIEFEDLGQGRTRYTATGRHWSVEDCQKHAEMGFVPGWNMTLDQLVELAGKI